MRKIYKSVFRDIWHHKSRSIIAIIAIFIVISFPLAMFSTSPSLASSIEDDSERYKLAHLDIRFQYANESIKTTLNQTIFNETGKYPDAIEARIISSQQLYINKNWYQSYFVGYNPNKTYTINQIKTIEGRMPKKSNEITLLSSLAEVMAVDINDTISINSNGLEKIFKIVGLV